MKQTNKTRTNSEFDSVRDYYEQGEIHLDLNSKNDEGTDHRSKSSSIEKSEGFGIEIVHEKLRNKVYKAFSDFYDDIVKMLKCVEGYWARVKSN